MKILCVPVRLHVYVCVGVICVGSNIERDRIEVFHDLPQGCHSRSPDIVTHIAHSNVEQLGREEKEKGGKEKGGGGCGRGG
jgi:hypothetical protein